MDHCERIQNFRKTGNLKDLYRNKLEKDFFDHDAAYSDSKDLAKRTVSYKILKDRPYKIARYLRYDGYKRALSSVVYKFLEKEAGSGASVNKALAEELHKPIIIKFKRRRVYTRFIDIWAADLAEIRLFSSKNQTVKHLLCVMDVFTKYAWVKPMKDEKSKTFLDAFIEIVNESNRKPNKSVLIKEEKFKRNLCKTG